MSVETVGETNACRILWKIENISHCWLKKEEQIKSSTFIADILASTKWSLRLLPIGKWCEKNIELRLLREKNCSGPDVIDINYKLEFLSKDGSFLKEKCFVQTFRKDVLGYNLGEERRKVFFTDREAFLPDDTLTVRCTIWKQNEIHAKTKELFARTVLKVKHRIFSIKIEKFSTLQTGIINTFKNDSMDFSIVLKEGLDFEEKLVIDVISFDKSIKYILFKINVINSEGKKEYYGNHEYFEADLKNGILSTLLSTRMLMENKSRYLPNDILSLDFKYLYSTGSIADQFCSYEQVSSKIMKVNSKEHSAEQPNVQLTSVLIKDLKSMYIDGIFSDTELRTSTQTFPAHKGILGARSPVFRRMFSNDMKEKNTGHIDIADLEDDTVYRMLLYLYTDSLEDLQLENACKLYVAADKYEILILRSRLSSFLIDSLSPDKACDILVLADRHLDDVLKSAVEDFILCHDEVFGSQEWKHLMTTNLKLAADIMYRRIYPG